MKEQLGQLKRHELLDEEEISEICSKAIEILILEPNIKRVNSPTIVVGDIHGQFSDLLQIFNSHGTPENVHYVFLGDFVDRGENSLECILCLLIYKIHYPANVTLLRGNHEQKIINKVYGFYDEVCIKYSNNIIWKMINSVFDHLSIVCIIDGRYFCVHGGISPRVSINELERVDRFEKIADQSIINDIIWSDPFYRMGASPNPRGNGFLFGEDVLKQFLIFNNVEILIRSHQLAIEGFKWDFDGHCLTIWSAPDYMGKCSNPASVLLIERNMPITPRSIKIFQKAKPSTSASKNTG
ncbi:uncharacterized protein VICG_00495 [Vittaforma corneae ATCC 50505]|uniref:Serine/threonine-protein phosphatase n=1 Tax=Vittaforma corneae (strain ATCC 50505) TaxID=993615 RepID=L2GNI0_VITCO|nr:uncharacterized protein VICG_00495 [Vittaforma corneae ATCC 50505]ELA42396.1 hypothetical protein VICG_00495 [Vittaforma corneae ATCC 50505]